MVSRNNILLIGAAILLVSVGGLSLFGSKKAGPISQTVFRTTDPPPLPPLPNPNAQEIKGLSLILNQAQSILKTRFKDPIIPKGLTTGGKTFPCRGPNCLGLAQARGTLTGFDPFTGQRVILAGSQKFQNITGQGSATFAFNQSRISAGIKTKMDLTDFIANIRQQIGILESTNTVSL